MKKTFTILIAALMLLTMINLPVNAVGQKTDPTVLFHETFGEGSTKARNWSDTYSVKSGVAAVYENISAYSMTNLKQSNNNSGSSGSGGGAGLIQTSGEIAEFVSGPYNVSNYVNLNVTYDWKAASIKNTYYTKLYYKTSSSATTWIEVTGGSGNGATTYVQRSYSLPSACQVETLYLKVTFYTSNTQALIDEFEITGTASGGGSTPSINAENVSVTYNATNGTIEATINNAVEGGELSAEITNGNNGSWLTLGDVDDTDVPLTINSSNNDVISRSATVTLTYTYNTNQTVTKEVTVTQGVNPIYGSSTNPYTVAQAIAVIDAAGKTTVSDKYVRGIICQIDAVNINSYATYWISDDGGTTTKFEIYHGQYLSGDNFTSTGQIQLGDVVVVSGNITYYSNSSIYEFEAGSSIASLKLVAPTFYPAEGPVGSGTALTISDLHTDATIYYTTDGYDPTNLSAQYNSSNKPTITAPTTFKAIAVKSGCTDSDVASAAYTILVPVETPVITLPEDEYTSVQSTTITCGTTGATIYYTTDESNPTTESSVYSGPISINEDMTIKAMATKEGMANSAVTAKTYLITLPVINAENVNLTCDATSASIAYTITNPVEGGVITSAAVSNDTPIGWLTVSGSNPYPNPIGLLCSANSTASNRTAKVTLTYTYDTDKTVTKEVTVTQAAYFPTPTNDEYVRISSLDQLVDGCIVIIAARYNTTANAYYAMANTTSGKPAGTQFTSATNNDNGNEILPESLLSVNEQNVQANYYWVVNITENGYTFTNPSKNKIGYGSSGTDFVTNGNKTGWSISKSTSASSGPMVKSYSGFVISNTTTNTRAFAFNGSAFGPYSTGNNNMISESYNFYLDFFVQMPTISMDIVGVDNSGGGYYLIASPYASPVTPTEDNGFFANDYDLYRFNQSAVGAEWENWKATTNENHSDFTALVSSKGYLYANSKDVTLYFTGHPYTGNGEVALSYDEDNASAKCLGWNLIGNPYNSSATVSTSFYIMNDTRDELTASESSTVGAMEGIFVKATEEGQSVTFTQGSKRSVNSQIVLNVVGNNDNLIDRAIVRFDESGTLPKFMIDESNTRIYIPQNNKNFAVVNSNGKADMPVNFKAKEMGKYTISVNTEGIDMDYLHLIDRLTGEDVNLLLDNSYSFIASAQDVESRFILSFTASGYNQDADEPFAFQNGSDIIVNGSGELQIFDLMGRMVSTQNVNGIETINVKSQGVYIFRLNEKTQKIVVR